MSDSNSPQKRGELTESEKAFIKGMPVLPRQYEADLVAEIVQLKAERDSLKARVKELSGICARYEEALVWYASDEVYIPRDIGLEELTKRARQALGEEKQP